VHKKTVVTTVMLTQPDGSVQEHVRTSSTMTTDLLALDDWLRSLEVEVIAMESTGVFTLTSIDFLPLGTYPFARAAFLSFSALLFLVRFLLLHS
jgi:hypothetical protein